MRDIVENVEITSSTGAMELLRELLEITVNPRIGEGVKRSMLYLGFEWR